MARGDQAIRLILIIGLLSGCSSLEKDIAMEAMKPTLEGVAKGTILDSAIDSLVEPTQRLIPEREVNFNELDSINTIAVLKVPEISTIRKGQKREFVDSRFGFALQKFLKSFLGKNGYEIIEYEANRTEKYLLMSHYGGLSIDRSDAYLDVVPIDIGYKPKETSNFLDRAVGPHVSTAVRLVSVKTNSIIYEGSIQYGWGIDSSHPGVKIDSPELHRYENIEAVTWGRDEAFERLIYGIEAVSLNISKKISKNDFVGSMRSPIIHLLTDAEEEPEKEFVKMARDEFGSGEQDRSLWITAKALSDGSRESTERFYIKLRSSQLNEEKKRADGITQLAQLPNISGTYISEITESSSRTVFDKRYLKTEITLRQDGNTVTGTDRSRTLEINGTREGSTIRFYIIGGNQIDGVWDINANATKLEGKWNTDGGGGASGKWNLTKIK